MKKLSMLLITILCISCSKDEKTQSLCKCYIITKAVYHPFTNVTTMTIKNNCKNELKEIEPIGYYEINKQYCE